MKNDEQFEVTDVSVIEMVNELVEKVRDCMITPSKGYTAWNVQQYTV